MKCLFKFLSSLCLALFMFLGMILFMGCGKEDTANNPFEDEINEQLDENLEVGERAEICTFSSMVDEDGCCIYYLPPTTGYFYSVDGMRVSSKTIKVCEGESVYIKLIEIVPENPSGIRVDCTQTLTCSCCNQIEYNVTYHFEEPNCCRIEVDFNMPECVQGKIKASVSPRGLTDNFTFGTVNETELQHDIRICGSGMYPEGATLFIQFKIDEQCKSEEISLPLPTCF